MRHLFSDIIPSGAIKLLAEALISGAAPSLRHLGLDFCDFEDEDVEALATMLEARAQNPDCRASEKVDRYVFIGGSDELSDRVMRALLPSLTELKLEYWNDTYDRNESRFTSVRPPQLKRLEIQFDDNQEGRIAVPPSVAMLESMPALDSLSYWANLLNPTMIVDFEPIILALNGGVAFRNLQASDAWDRMLFALAGAPCALQFTTLELAYTSLSLANLSTLSTLLSENTFPMLQDLKLTSTPLGDRGVEILVQGLLTPACGTRLTKLNLSKFEFGDQGMAALARVIREGRFELLEDIDLSHNLNVTDQGMRILARAVQDAGDRGLLML